MTAPSDLPNRLLIGASCLADALSALNLARQLGEALASDVSGLLVEETLTAEVLGRPGQRVVTAGGSLVEAPSRQQIRSLNESDARAFREALAEFAQSRARTWSFERGRGDLIGLLCGAATGRDILLFGNRQFHRQAGKVVLIAPPGRVGLSAKNLAENLAKALRTELVAASVGSAMPDGEEPHGRQVDTFASEATLLAFVDRTNAAAVALDLSAGPFHTHDQLRHLLAAARCPILVFGAASREPRTGR